MDGSFLAGQALPAAEVETRGVIWPSSKLIGHRV
jgi:hypothetical protein